MSKYQERESEINNSGISAAEEILKLRKEIEQLSMSVNQIKQRNYSPETIKMPKRNKASSRQKNGN